MHLLSDVADDTPGWDRALTVAGSSRDSEGGTGAIGNTRCDHRGVCAVCVDAFLFDFNVDQLAVFELDDAGRVLANEVVVMRCHEDGGAAHVDFLEQFHDF